MYRLVEIHTDEPGETYRHFSHNGVVQVGALTLHLREDGTLVDEQGQVPPWRWQWSPAPETQGRFRG